MQQFENCNSQNVQENLLSRRTDMANVRSQETDDYGGEKPKHHHGKEKTYRAIHERKTLIFVQPTTTDSQSACVKKRQ